jgi:SAM-dependent methyltransferase
MESWFIILIVCADATIETIEHIRDQMAFLDNIKCSLKQGGKLILSTPNKIITSPFLLKPLNPYHVNEFYLGTLLNILRKNGFKVDYIYGGKRVSRLELLRRIFGSLLKFLLSKFSLNPHLLDDFYHSIYNFILMHRQYNSNRPIEPDPSLIIHEEVESHSNVILYEYFLICAHL